MQSRAWYRPGSNLMPSIAHIAALLVAGSWTLFALQGGGSSPFASAPLPLDELKAPPDRAFEVVMICAAVFPVSYTHLTLPTIYSV